MRKIDVTSDLYFVNRKCMSDLLLNFLFANLDGLGANTDYCLIDETTILAKRQTRII